MKTIYKYELGKLGQQPTIKIPADAKFLSAKEQNNQLCVWALVNPKNKSIPYTFDIIATGQKLSDEFGKNEIFIDTIKQYDGAYIWHIFVKS